MTDQDPGGRLTPAEFDDLMGRVRAGDERAAAEFVRRYEPAIRRAIRIRLTGPALRRLLDSTDVCQSVLGRFFAAARRDRCPTDPGRLLAWLAQVARNRLRDHLRRQLAARRRPPGAAPSPAALADVPDPAPGPGAALADRDCVELVTGRMTAPERDILRRLADGESWPAIAAAHGTTPGALRKRYRRAVDQIIADLGLGHLDGRSRP